jgi:hypothetical protein
MTWTTRTGGFGLAKGLIFGALACSLSLAEARAVELAAGVMAGGTGTRVSNSVSATSGGAAISQSAGGASFGFILEQRFFVPGVLLEAFEDFQPTPLPVQTGSATHTAGYMPVDIGVRLGFASSALQPYLGVIFQGLFLTGHPGEGAPLKQAAFGVGGALGVDLAVFFVRLGLEARLTETVTDLSPNCPQTANCSGVLDPGNVAIFQVLLSLRSAF